MHNSQDLNGRRAVVTGGAAGLGFAIARALEGAGAAVTVIDLAAALENASLPGSWQSVAMDLGAAGSLRQQKTLAAELGRVDIVVANAGLVPPWRSAGELDAEEWQQVMNVNTWGVAATLGGFAEALSRSRCGSAVLMASINGYKAHPAQMLYTASKHAVVGIMRAAALELGREGTRVNALAPGPVATAALRQRLARRHAEGGPAPEDALSSMAADTALGHLVNEEQVASAALWLASDASAGTTGTLLPVEAGLS